MLNARYAVVSFTGRSHELRQLRTWRDNGPRLAARWLHGDGGQGKSRLAAKLAAESAAAGWKVLTAIQGPHTIAPPTAGPDLRLDGHAGLLLLVDYANEWPPSHLAWLLRDAVFHQVATRTRVLLLARSHGDWQGLRSRLEELEAEFSVQRLDPLPGGAGAGSRQEMFAAARAAFCARYGLSGANDLRPAADLGRPEFGLTLAVHMAALVAVDAAARGAPPPRGAGMADLTRYLLNREYKHWEQQYGDPEHELNPESRAYFTPPPLMNRVVFTAALTGPADPAAGTAVLTRQALPLATPRLLADHATCYPPADPDRDSVLEPLYPDRLTEDFIALTLPGHGTDHPEQQWAARTAVDVLLPLSPDTFEPTTTTNADTADAPPWTTRALVFLAAAAARWPHVGPTVLYPWAVVQPQRVLAGGSAALSALAAIGRDNGPVLAPELHAALASVHRVLPPGRNTDLDSGMADLTERLAGHVLATRRDRAARIEWLCDSGIRLGHAGRHEQAAARFAAAEPIARKLARRGRSERQANLAFVLCHLGSARSEAGDRQAAVAPLEESVLRYRRLAAAAPAQYAADMAMAASNLGGVLSKLGRNEQALDAAGQAVASLQSLPGARDRDPRHRSLLAAALGNRSIIEFELGRLAAALEDTNRAAAILRELAAQDPTEHLPFLALSLNGLGNSFDRLGKHQDALAPTREAEGILRTLTKSNPEAHRPTWATTASNLGLRLANLGEKAEALGFFEEAVATGRLLAEANPSAYLPDLARYLVNLGTCLNELGRPDQAHTALSDATGTYRALAKALPDAHLPRLAGALNNLGTVELRMGHVSQSAETLTECVNILRFLRAQSPATHQQLFVLALHNLADAFVALSRLDEAAAVAREAVDSGPDPSSPGPVDAAVHVPGSAMALLSLADTLSGQDRDVEAADASGQAVSLLRELARDNPNHSATLAVALHNHGIHLACIDETNRAIDSLRESIGLLRPLAEANPAAHSEQLGTGLYVLGCVLADDPDHRAAAVATATFEDAATVFALCAEQRTTAAPLHSAAKLNEICDAVFELHDFPRALALAEDTAARFRRLAAADPDRYQPALVLALSRLCVRTYNDSRMADAKAIGTEALALLSTLTAAQRAAGEAELREAQRSIEALGNFDNPWART
jgi:tetratricopeptide (TPR) repeat protein